MLDNFDRWRKSFLIGESCAASCSLHACSTRNCHNRATSDSEGSGSLSCVAGAIGLPWSWHEGSGPGYVRRPTQTISAYNFALPHKESDIGTMGTDYGSLASPTGSLAQGISYANTALSPTSTRNLKRSVSSDDEGENGDGDARPSSSRRHTSVKRACNECRQQKVSNALHLHLAIHGRTMRLRSKR